VDLIGSLPRPPGGAYPVIASPPRRRRDVNHRSGTFPGPRA
jgi:hypothetical protein